MKYFPSYGIIIIINTIFSAFSLRFVQSSNNWQSCSRLYFKNYVAWFQVFIKHNGLFHSLTVQGGGQTFSQYSSLFLKIDIYMLIKITCNSTLNLILNYIFNKFHISYLTTSLSLLILNANSFWASLPENRIIWMIKIGLLNSVWNSSSC